ncbi:docking protein 3 [Carettochelys insculpta]|uniref:docking protein 3 n=1 Tax=Carettochelys insculpta TaxID=44489 RepID=UPI003EBA98F8
MVQTGPPRRPGQPWAQQHTQRQAGLTKALAQGLGLARATLGWQGHPRLWATLVAEQPAKGVPCRPAGCCCLRLPHLRKGEVSKKGSLPAPSLLTGTAAPTRSAATGPMETPVQAGVLYLQYARFGKKSWRKVRAQLFAPSPYGVARLETCDLRGNDSGLEKASLRKGEHRVIRLADCISVGPADAPGCPPGTAAFCLSTLEKRHVLAAEQRDEWIAQLCQLAFQGPKELPPGRAQEPPGPHLHIQENSLYSSWQELSEFMVLVHTTDASTRCGLRGRYLLAALPEGLVLKAPQSRQLLLTWPYPFLRKFGHDQATFSFEAGRRCDSGEGVFTMGTSRAPELCSLVCAAIARQSESLSSRGRVLAPEALSSSQGPEPRLQRSQSLEEAGRSPLSVGLCAESGQASPSTQGPGAHARTGAELPIVYASIRRGLPPSQPMPWGEAPEEQPPGGAAWEERPQVSEHLYENLCAPEQPGCMAGGGSSGLGSRGSPEGSHTSLAPLYDNSCMASKRWSSPPAPSTGPSPSLEAQCRRLLGLEGQQGGEEQQGEEDALVGSFPKASVNSGFRKLVALLSRELVSKAADKTPSPPGQA